MGMAYMHANTICVYSPYYVCGNRMENVQHFTVNT